MIDPNDNKTLDLVEVVSGRPALRLVEVMPAPPSVEPASAEKSDGPLSAAARQRRKRANRKKLSVEQGLKAVWLTKVDRQLLEITLNLFHSLKLAPVWSESLAGILKKLSPGATWSERPDYVDQVASLAEVERLRRQVDALERDNSEVHAERGKAMDAVQVLQARLARAGLVSDYRRQPGE